MESGEVLFDDLSVATMCKEQSAVESGEEEPSTGCKPVVVTCAYKAAYMCMISTTLHVLHDDVSRPRLVALQL